MQKLAGMRIEGVVCLLTLAGTGIALAATVIHMEQAVGGLYSVYSPSVLQHGKVKRMWSGGWLTAADVGPDKIYYSEQRNGRWSHPVLSFSKPGYHVNDPSVIQHPLHSSWLFMYYTALANQHATERDMIRRNVVGFASSMDGGKSWTDHDIVIHQFNRIDPTGAWSPSAVVVGDEIWVYFHTNFPAFRIQRTVFDLSGWRQLRTETVISGPTYLPSGEGVYFSNVDVSRQAGRYVMLANTTDLKRVVRMVSEDGVNWSSSTSGRRQAEVLIDGGSNLVLTPHSEPTADYETRLHFGYDTGFGSKSIQTWTFRN